MHADTTPHISIRSVTKRFPGVVALTDVSIDVAAGELHSICGENGAGKSTLMKILSGVLTEYDGEIALKGQAARFDGTRDAEAAGGHLGSFQLVEGRVLEAAVVRGRAYLNFGADWREDFTVTLAPKVRRRFEAEGIDPRDYRGTRLRVRGWLKSYNGPMIEVTHPEQIEVLEP